MESTKEKKAETCYSELNACIEKSFGSLKQ